jgi:hypothetical protein
MLKLIDRWTTQHGSWDVNPQNKYGIDQAHRDKYLAGRDIPGSGGDHHIFVKAKPGSTVSFRTADGRNVEGTVRLDSWINLPIYDGGWEVWVNGERAATDIGFPGGEHVSTFLVVDEDEQLQPVPQPTNDKYQLFKNGELVWQS